MSVLQAELFPDRISLAVLDCEPSVTVVGAVTAFSERGLTLTLTDPEAIGDFPEGTRVHAGYGDPSGFCEFDSEVVAVSAGDGAGAVGTVRLRAPAQIRTTQRRRTVRADVELTAPCALFDDAGPAFRTAPSEVRSLSGGGLMMIIAAHPALRLGSSITVALPLPGRDPVVAFGRVVDLVSRGDSTTTVRLAFTALDAPSRDRVERFVFRRLGGPAPAKLWATGKVTTSGRQPDVSGGVKEPA
jgi:hypothetical protein